MGWTVFWLATLLASRNVATAFLEQEAGGGLGL